MGLKDKLRDFVSPPVDETYEYEEDEETVGAAPLSDYESARGSAKLPADAKVVLFEPRSYEETVDIAQYLKDKKAAVVNLHRLQRDYAQRTTDFLYGVVFALDGSIQKIGHNVILCTPKSIAVSGEIDLSNEEN